jgi:hypothetical protein
MNHTTAIEDPSIEGAQIGERDPAEVLLGIIVALLAPMFILASNGDIACARMAARQTVMAYRARSDAELIAVVQIIAFGLAALASLSRSMEDDLSLNMTLRLRANANACNRGAEHNRRALKDLRADKPTPHHAEQQVPPDEGFDEVALMASVATALEKTGQDQPPTKATAPSIPAPTAAAPTIPAPTQPTPTQSPPTQSERQIQVAWAAGMARVAAKYTADLHNLSPLERRQASIRATALSSCAHDLLAGNVGPRPRPGDLAALMQPMKR